jgi:hypothetical protein
MVVKLSEGAGKMNKVCLRIERTFGSGDRVDNPRTSVSEKSKTDREKGTPERHAMEGGYELSAYKLLSFTHERMLNTYTPIQNRFAGMNPSWPVRIPITQMIPLFTPATASPVHRLRPTRSVERTVRQQDR